MKAELRIGNHIGQGEVMEIKENVVRVKYTADKVRTSLIRYEDIQPIPLSEEVLFKCGATLDGIEYIIKASALPIKIRFHSGIAYCEFGNVYLGDRIKYLHELQNLVFALCGREMEVSP